MLDKLKKHLVIIISSIALIIGLISDTMSLSERITFKTFGIPISLPVITVEFQELASFRIVLPPVWLICIALSILIYKSIRFDYDISIFTANNLYKNDPLMLDYHYFYPSDLRNLKGYGFPLLSLFSIIFSLLFVKLLFSINILWLFLAFVLLILVLNLWLTRVFRNRFWNRVEKHHANMEYLREVAND